MGKEYCPNTIIQHLHDHKKSYQPNLLKALSCVSVLLLVMGGIIATISIGLEDDLIRINSNMIVGGDRGVPFAVEKKSKLYNIPNQSNYNQNKHDISFANGYLGKVRIVHDFPLPVFNNISTSVSNLSTEISFISDLSLSSENIGEEDGNTFGYGFTDGDFGLPSDQPFLPPYRNDWEIMENGYYGDFLLNRPAIMKLGSPSWPALASEDDTGFVEVEFMIFHTGYISNWNDIKIIREFPEDKGFGQAVKRAIYKRSIFEAAIQNGSPINTFINLQVTICHECKSFITSEYGNVQVSSLKK